MKIIQQTDNSITIPCWNTDRTYMVCEVARILDPKLALMFDPIQVPGLGVWCLDPYGSWWMRFDSRSGSNLVQIYSIHADIGILNHIVNRIRLTDYEVSKVSDTHDKDWIDDEFGNQGDVYIPQQLPTTLKLTGFPMQQALGHELVIGWTKIIPDLEQAIKDGRVVGIGLLSSGYRVNVSTEASDDLIRSMQYIGIEVVQNGK